MALLGYKEVFLQFARAVVIVYMSFVGKNRNMLGKKNFANKRRIMAKTEQQTITQYSSKNFVSIA